MAYEGPKVFRAPIGNDAAQENFRRTVLDGVSRDKVEAHTDPSVDSTPIRVWGTKETVESTWENISPGDFLIFYRDGTYEYAAEVISTERNEELGREIWPNFEEDSPWVCVIYLQDPVQLNVDSAEIHDLAGYDIDYPMGFSPLNEMGIGGIRGRYGSVESFVYGGEGSVDIDVTAVPDYAVPATVLEGLHFPSGYTVGVEDLVGKVTDALNAGKHIIFTGPPGTGKTEIARRVSDHLAETHTDVYTGFEMTTATADWSTFETVGGYMPQEEGNGELAFNPGQVLRCFKRQNAQQNNLLIIDEINRSDIDKSFGQLFTLLSGQRVQLPFTRNGQEVDILPAEDVDESPAAHEFIVPASWRIFATMNSYDKTSLYEMSYAFMRRFAFIYVEAPDVPQGMEEQGEFVREYAETWGIEADAEVYQDVGGIWHELNTGDAERPIGPALIRDILKQVAGSSRGTQTALTDAISNYVFPQLEGIRRRQQVVSALARLDQLHGEELKSVASDVLDIRPNE